MTYYKEQLKSDPLHFSKIAADIFMPYYEAPIDENGASAHFKIGEVIDEIERQLRFCYQQGMAAAAEKER